MGRSIAFAILGSFNKDIEKDIERLQNILGDEKKATGLYSERNTYKAKYSIYNEDLKNIEKNFQKSLSEKATGKEIGIKYKRKFDKIYYDIKALRLDIEKVNCNNFNGLEHDRILSYEVLLNEYIKEQIEEIPEPILNFNLIQEQVSKVVTKVVGKADKVDSLIKNAILNRWVKEGKELHSPNSTCNFCNAVISTDRWNELDRHFDEESENLESEIVDLLNQIDKEEQNLNNFRFYKQDFFYTKFHKEFITIRNSIDEYTTEYKKSLKVLRTQLLVRQNAILEANDFHYESVKHIGLQDTFKDLEYLRHQSNYYTQNLKSDKESAKENLRLQDIYEYLKEIRYTETVSRIEHLKELLFEIEVNEISLDQEISKIILEISDNKKLIKDESKGAEKINEYLEHHFGHKNLRLAPIKILDLYAYKTVFEVQRDGKKAHHLSEGEKSLIAFCYFIAKLEDIETKGLKPIIWIDDPISSLDSNHIFFIYSLIKSEIYDKKDFIQLFISTHNLNFLKYLKRLPTKKDKDINAVKYFLVERIDEFSTLLEMPKYLQEHVTEFNYLFKSVYECANIKSINDSNYTLFYNFGNNVRKFLEIYLFYKYPNFENDDVKYKRFFGEDPIPAILTNRLINEYSHLCGVMERGETPIEVPEMKKAAEIICKKIEEKDKDQFDALVKSLK